jgi:4-hydroxy-4-methyl-2-oxoglutarate aldolase
VLSSAQLDSLTQFDTCILSDALETFELRLRNQGYTRPGLRCVTGDFPPVVGYAVTARIRSSDPPTLGNSYVAHHDWWPEISRRPSPRIAVLEDMDPYPGVGACVGQVTAAMFQAFECAAVITNGSARDLGEISNMGLPVLAASVSPSHSYAHIVDYAQPVDIFGLIIHAGDLLIADCHGVVSIPAHLVPKTPSIAQDLQQRKRKFVDFCRSPDFSIDRLADEVKQLKP